MKKFLLAAAVMVAPSMFAASITELCSTTPSTIANGSGTVSFTCAAFGTISGATSITSVEIFDTADYSYGSTTPDTVVTVFTPATTNSTWSPTTATCTTTGTGSSNAGPCTPTGLTSGVEQLATGNFAAYETTGFTVSATASTTSGSVGVSTAGVVAEIDYTTAAPEPGSMILLGSGLLAAGLIGRKKLVRK